jgi:peptidyl-prolyl cis-trans isomerase C
MKYRYVLALALVAIAATACSKNAVVALKPEQIFATVNGENISVKEFDNFVTAASGGSVTADKLTAEQRQKLSDRLVGMHVAAAEAAKAGMDQQYETASLISMWRANTLSDAMIKQFLEKNPISDADVQAEYDSQIAAMPREYKASHILVKTKDEADALLAKLKSGADFADLAKKNSTDPGSAKNGGDLGWFAPSSMVKEFGEAVAKLEKGKMTETPVQTQYGFHIIKLEDTRTPTPPALTENGVKTQIENIVKQKKIEKYLTDLRKTAKVEVKTAAVPASAASSESSK